MSQRICLLPGDGIGPEVISQAEIVLKSLPLDLEFVYGEIGFGAYQKYGTPLPALTLEQILAADATLFGHLRQIFCRTIVERVGRVCLDQRTDLRDVGRRGACATVLFWAIPGSPVPASGSP